jgi:hypothetical protein
MLKTIVGSHLNGKDFGAHQIEKQEAVNILNTIINHTNNGINYFTIKLLIVGNFHQSSCWGPNSILSSHIAGFIAKIMFEKIYKMRTFPKFVVQL